MPQYEMISFERRVIDEYRIKIAKIETLARTIDSHLKSTSAVEFLVVLINETDRFYKENGAILSKNGKRPHNRSQLKETREWSKNIEKFYEKHPRIRRK